MNLYSDRRKAPGAAARSAPSTARQALLGELRVLVRQDLSLRERILSRHSTAQALRIVLGRRVALLAVSARCGVPAACLETILFREQRMVNLADAAADFLVQPLRLRTDSSTGLMQIKGSTALAAIRQSLAAGWIVPEALGFDAGAFPAADNGQACAAVWRRLRAEPDFNITVGALVLLCCAQETVQRLGFSDFSEEELIKTFARYNGHGEAARAYGRACCVWLRAFDAFEAAQG